MGPGFHARVEKEVLGSKFPWIDFWDQPSTVPQTKAFLYLVEESLKKLRLVSENNGKKPVVLIGHSFGGQLAKYLVEREPQMVASILLINSAFDPYQSFVFLAEALSKSNLCSSEIKEKLMRAANMARGKREWANLAQLLGVIAGIENFYDLYWCDKSKFKDYVGVAIKHPPLDLTVFMAILGDFVTNYDPYKFKNVWQGPVQLKWSRGDVLGGGSSESYADWIKVFPSAQVEEVPLCGHFAHFELDASVLFGAHPHF